MNVGHAGWSPDYRHAKSVVLPKRRGKPRVYECPCGNTALNVHDSKPPDGWRWDGEAEAWVCEDCAVTP